jgi:hypothetical protein
MNNFSDWEYFQIYVKGTQFFQQTRLAIVQKIADLLKGLSFRLFQK